MAKPEVGLSMLYCLSKRFEEMIEEIPRAKMTYVEIVDDGLHELNRQRVRVLNDVGASYCLKYSVHAPFSDVNIASPSKFLLKAMLKRLELSMQCARSLNAYMWVFHPGMKTGISSFYPGEDWNQNLETVRCLFKMAKEHGLKIAIENVPEPFPFLMKSVEDFGRFYTEFGESMGLVLDVGHANLNGQIERFFGKFSDRIVHMHLSDNDGKHDQHLGIGYGTIDWDKVSGLVKKMSHDKVIVVESIERVEESVARIKRLLA